MSAIFTQLSPGVEIIEVDETNYLTAQATTRGGTYIDSDWGEAFKATNITGINSLKATFGKSTNTNYVSWNTVNTYTKYSANMDVVRAIDENAINADDTGSGILIENRDTFKTLENSPQLTGSLFSARFAGEAGNSIEVVVIDSSNWSILPREYKNLFEQPPTTSPNIKSMGGRNDEIHVLVLDAKGRFTGRVGAPLEIYRHLSKSLDGVDGDNISNYYRNHINNVSKYIYALDIPSDSLMQFKYKVLKDIIVETKPNQQWMNPKIVIKGDGEGVEATIKSVKDTSDPLNPTYSLDVEVIEGGEGYTYYDIDIYDADNILYIPISIKPVTEVDPSRTNKGEPWGTSAITEDGRFADYAQLEEPLIKRLIGGKNTVELSEDDIIRAFEVVATGDVSYLVGGDCGGERYYISVAQHIIDLAETKGTMIAVVSPPLSALQHATTLTEIKNNILAIKNRIGRASSYVIYDDNWAVVNDPNSKRDRLIPMSAVTAGLWARIDKRANFWESTAGGEHGRVVGIKSLVWEADKNERDDLYPQSVNSYMNSTKYGIILYGDRTGQIRESAFRFVGTRKLFIMMRKVFGDNIQSVLFKTNNEFTRKGFKNTAEAWLRHVQGRGGLYVDGGKDGFYVWCDEKNNDKTVIQQRGFNATIMVKPTLSVNFIHLTLTAVDYNLSFEEIVDKNS